jgi:hypothetical protein
MSDLRKDQLPPKDLWLGKTDGEWPITVLHSEAQVIAWLESNKQRVRRAWKITSYELGPELTVIYNKPILAEVRDE